MKPKKWKMALLVWTAMFPFSTAVSYGLAELSFTAQWPLVLRTFCLTCLLVPYMVFGVFPFLNRRFKTWLQGAETPTRRSTPSETPGDEMNSASRPSESGRLSTGLTPNGDDIRLDATPIFQRITA